MPDRAIPTINTGRSGFGSLGASRRWSSKLVDWITLEPKTILWRKRSRPEYCSCGIYCRRVFGRVFLNQPAINAKLSMVSHAARWRVEAGNAIQGRTKTISSAEHEMSSPKEAPKIFVPYLRASACRSSSERALENSPVSCWAVAQHPRAWFFHRGTKKNVRTVLGRQSAPSTHHVTSGRGSIG